MKNLTFAVTMFIAITGLTAFGQENKKAADARKELTEAKKDSAADFQKFKKEAQMKISDNQKAIAELKAKKSNDTKEVKAKYDQKVLALEQKNNALKKKIETCDNTKTSMWTSFKKGFTNDMDELGRAIKNI